MSPRSVSLALALLLAPVLALAQVTYRCASADGKKYYGSTIPPQCYGRPVEQINSQGLVVKRIDPEGEAKERAEKEAALAKKKEEDSVTKEETRRNRALLATYTSEKDIEEARRRALADNEQAVKDVEAKIDALKKTRAKYDKELEFYEDKKAGKARPPAKLSADIKNAEIDLKAQEDLLAAKKKEVNNINAKYDEDKKRFAELRKKGSVR
jgi:chromosome segregation ATPase